MSGIIEYPLVTEKAMDDMDFGNKLQFIVDVDATKTDVSEEISSQYDVTVESVNTQVTMDGTKKAIVKLSEEDDAQDVASRIGVF
ncbi:50S ribosomal protein L23 [Halarchaeum nitratireducens]|uniref:Large ribosomal subunit protein uL23 n=1 Tax=Halarchaeum nitratireducens TaxID=489913 RepID=A0A830G7J8_9EURY|nr:MULTISPECIES: 50S ribosomal protein L23 [Halarchaeum]MBP2251352.1 large subunit ribosomal protein L23 [Halarchaeum solikamskense]GGN07832.1 50S ribosomal protein L23 [Halarchaeum nitratireducens]